MATTHRQQQALTAILTALTVVLNATLGWHLSTAAVLALGGAAVALILAIAHAEGPGSGRLAGLLARLETAVAAAEQVAAELPGGTAAGGTAGTAAPAASTPATPGGA